MVKSYFYPFSLLLLLFLAACQSTTTPVEVTTALVVATKTPHPIETAVVESSLDVTEKDLDGIEIEVWHTWFGASAALFDLQIAEFNEENPWGITVSATYRGSYNMLFNEVTDALVTETPPDLVVALSEQISVWNETDSVKDLTPYILDPIWGMTVAEQTDFPRVFLRQDQRSDRWLALPAQRTARFILYNQTWGEELGFNAPPVNYEEFREQTCAANQFMRSDEDFENDGKGGWIVDHDSISALSWMLAFGGGPITDDAYQFVSSENITTLRSLKALYDEECAWISTADTPYEQFAGRSALFITAGMEQFTEISRTFDAVNNHDEWTVIPFPGGTQSTVVTYGDSYALLATEDADALASWLFVKWMLAPQQQTKWVKSTALFPLRISSLEELSDFEKANPQWSQAVNLITQAETFPQLSSWRQVRYLLSDGLEYIYRYDTQAGSVSAILALMDQTANALSE
ncbi:MAG: extracellular solute-binding protein [Anaerolineae bacterium]|jgi:ABC-type glycerol-3-phosphate transport system substrate-binding protein|nr:extracellular solute-binding protein [Anaerolineae bacterium]MBT7069392.1 extracellular solute-binding protein [Anaerolineae bacterium]MBT7326561.1 extracellular solute-binding protein [Anaerolineae bacterium]